MTQVSDARVPTSVQPNIQDVFLNHARRERLQVVVYLLDGRQFEARVRSFDRFVIVFDVHGTDHLVFKHAIATVESPRAVEHYAEP